MKKLISILFLFVFSLFIANSQSKVTYIDSLKSVTVSVSSDTKKQLDTQNNLQSQFAKIVENQIVVNASLDTGISQLVAGVNAFAQEVEERNKNDSQLLTSKFNYSNEQVKHIIRVERWLNFIILFLMMFYLLIIDFQLNNRRSDYDHLFSRGLLYVIIGIITFFVLQNVLTLLFNGDYYIVKQLLTLYT